jgi:hypothetical protein
MSEDGSQGPEEPLFFHQEVALHALAFAIKLPDEKIPVAGMWCKADDVFVGVRFGHVDFPPHLFK